MSIIFAGGELEDFEIIGAPTCSNNTTSTNFRSAFCRAAISLQIITSSTQYLRKIFPSTYTSLWVTFRYRHSSATSTSQQPFIMLSDAAGFRRLGIVGSGTSGKLAISKRDNTGTYTFLTSAESGTFSSGTNYKYDLQIINYDDTVNGTINLYRANEDGTGSTLILTYTGDLTTNSANSIGGVFLGNHTNTTIFYYSEFIASTIDTRGMGLVTCESLANGNTFNWTGSEADIDDITLNDSDFITANADGDLAQVTLTTSRIGTPNSIRAFVIAHRSRAGSSVPKVTPNLRLGGTDYFGTQITPPAGFANYQEVFETNPNTGLAFVTSDLTTAGVNYGLRANT